MILSFATMQLRDQCQTLERADEAFGASAAQALFALLSDVEAAETAEEVLSLYGDAVKLCENDFFSIVFAPQCRAKFEPLYTKRTAQMDGQLEWSKVRRLKLTEVMVESA